MHALVGPAPCGAYIPLEQAHACHVRLEEDTLTIRPLTAEDLLNGGERGVGVLAITLDLADKGQEVWARAAVFAGPC